MKEIDKRSELPYTKMTGRCLRETNLNSKRRGKTNRLKEKIKNQTIEINHINLVLYCLIQIEPKQVLY